MNTSNSRLHLLSSLKGDPPLPSLGQMPAPIVKLQWSQYVFQSSVETDMFDKVLSTLAFESYM